MIFTKIHHSAIGRAAQVCKKWNELLKTDDVWESNILHIFPYVKPPKGKSRELFLDLIVRYWNPKKSFSLGGRKYICIPQRNESCFGRSIKDSEMVSISFSKNFVIVLVSIQNAIPGVVAHRNFQIKDALDQIEN